MLVTLSLRHVIYMTNNVFLCSCILYLRILHEEIYSLSYKMAYSVYLGASWIYCWWIMKSHITVIVRSKASSQQIRDKTSMIDVNDLENGKSVSSVEMMNHTNRNVLLNNWFFQNNWFSFFNKTKKWLLNNSNWLCIAYEILYNFTIKRKLQI